MYKNNRLITLIRKVSIRKRLLIGFISISLLSSLIIGGLAFNVCSISLKEKMSTTSSQILSALEPSIYNMKESYEGLMDQITLSPTMQEYLSHFSNLKPSELLTFYNSTTALLTAQSSRLPYTKDIFIYTNDGHCAYNTGYFSLSDTIISEIQKSLSTYTHSIFIPYKNASNNMILMARKITSLKSNTVLGYAIIAIDEGALSDLYAQVTTENSSQVIISNATGYILSSSSYDYTFGDLLDEIMLSTLQRDHLVITQSYKPLGWNLISLMPYSYIYSELSSLGSKISIIVFIFLILSLVLSFLIYESITTPLTMLINHLESSQDHTIAPPLRTDLCNDELSYLIHAFNHYSERIHTLIEEIKTIEKQKHTLKLKVLQAQINPHFLFNTLNSLRFVSMMSHIPHLSDGLGALGSLLSHTILHQNEFISLKEEIKNIQDYCLIQHIRYGNLFEVSYNIDPQLENLRVLKLLLQPIIENSILHGIDESIVKEEITLSAFLENDYLVIEIKDTGKGFSQEVQPTKKHNTLSGIGINNVDERLKLYFGDIYGLKINSEIHKGTCVTLTMPIIKEGEENLYA